MFYYNRYFINDKLNFKMEKDLTKEDIEIFQLTSHELQTFLNSISSNNEYSKKSNSCSSILSSTSNIFAEMLLKPELSFDYDNEFFKIKKNISNRSQNNKDYKYADISDFQNRVKIKKLDKIKKFAQTINDVKLKFLMLKNNNIDKVFENSEEWLKSILDCPFQITSFLIKEDKIIFNNLKLLILNKQMKDNTSFRIPTQENLLSINENLIFESDGYNDDADDADEEEEDNGDVHPNESLN
jgi:hypothetical protein